MVKVNGPTMMDRSMMVTWNMIYDQGMEYIDGLMVQDMKGSGGMV